MRFSLFVFGFACYLSAVLADRGSATNVVPTECNAAPTETSNPTSTMVTQAAAPTCFFDADPDGAQGLCPNLANGGWCDCGAAGTYSTLDSENVCGYGTLATSASIILSTTNCVSSTTLAVASGTPITVIPISGASPTPVASSSTPVSTAASKRRRATNLRKRGGTVTFDSSCDGAPPSGSSWGPNTGFATMGNVLQAAYNDAVTLATASQDVTADNVGFTHYFGGDGADVQLTHFQNMMRAIASSDINYSIQFVCQDTGGVCSTTSVLVTDATPGSATDVKNITVCPSFWTGASTKYLLYNPSNTSPSPPYRDNTSSGWCGKRAQGGDPNVSLRQNQFFATAGHSILHELTHLDPLANLAGLDGDPGENNAHGTADAQTGCELAGARAFLQSYINGQTDETSPDYNAESYPAAATEVYFMQLCSFSQIRPVTN